MHVKITIAITVVMSIDKSSVSLIRQLAAPETRSLGSLLDKLSVARITLFATSIVLQLKTNK